MPGSFVALLATAIHQVRNPDGSPVSLDRTVGLLARAAEGSPMVLERTADGIEANGVLISEPAPGVAVLNEALASHHTARLQLPGGMEPRHWRDVAEIYASAPGIYPTTANVLAALRVSVPLVEIWGKPTKGGQISRSPESGDSTPHDHSAPRDDLTPSMPREDVTNRAANLSDFSSLLGQLNTEGSAAAQREDAAKMARVLLGFQALELTGDPAQASVVAKERRRVVSPAVLDWLLREAIKPGAPATLPNALGTLGTEEMERILEALGRTTKPGERESLAKVFQHTPDLQSLVVLALRGGSSTGIRGATEIAGRHQLVATIPTLAGLLRHGDADVRTSAWHALEEIGTREAIEALNAKGR